MENAVYKFYKKIAVCWLAFSVIFLFVCKIQAQSSDEKKFEVGAQFSVLQISDPDSLNVNNPDDQQRRTEAGFGGRTTCNLNRNFALEAEVNFFPRDFNQVRTDFTGGRITQGLFGIKTGIRKDKIGIFGKARPGFVSSGGAVRTEFPGGNGPDPNNRFGLKKVRATQLTLDVGGVLEFYPSRRTIIRFDVGDTITRYPDVQFICFPAGILCPEDVYKHRLQISAGVGFRF